MSNIYVVTSGSYSDYTIDAIFSTEELANGFAEKRKRIHRLNDSVHDDYHVEEWEIDREHAEEEVWASVYIGRDFEIRNVYFNFTRPTVQEGRYESYTDDVTPCYLFFVGTEDRTRAVKVAKERLTRLILTEEGTL